VRADTDDLKPSTGSAAGRDWSGARVEEWMRNFERRRSGSNEMMCGVRFCDFCPQFQDLFWMNILALVHDG
jgi:hypothetical protein